MGQNALIGLDVIGCNPSSYMVTWSLIAMQILLAYALTQLEEQGEIREVVGPCCSCLQVCSNDEAQGKNVIYHGSTPPTDSMTHTELL